MTSEPATPAYRRTWRTWRRWLLVVLLGILGYGGWREYDFRLAIKEAQALGWLWEYDDPIEPIRKDWRAAFRKATWREFRRELVIHPRNGFLRNIDVVVRLAPRDLTVWDKLQDQDLPAFKRFSSLRSLHLRNCPSLTNVDGLKGLSALQNLSLTFSRRLTNLDALKGLTALQKLDLSNCTALTNVDALKGLRALQALDLGGCTNLSAEAIAALKAALPNTTIFADH